MRCILNVIWVVLSGLWLAFLYAFFGLVLCATVVFLPFGIQLLKIAGYVLWPFGRTVVKISEVPGVSTIGNVLWLPFGLMIAAAHLSAAARFPGLRLVKDDDTRDANGRPAEQATSEFEALELRGEAAEEDSHADGQESS